MGSNPNGYSECGTHKGGMFTTQQGTARRKENSETEEKSKMRRLIGRRKKQRVQILSKF